MCFDADRDCTTHAATSNSLHEQQEQFENNVFEGLLTAAEPQSLTVLVVDTKRLFLDTTKDGYAPVWLLNMTSETEEEGLDKLLPANKANHLCQRQSSSNFHGI